MKPIMTIIAIAAACLAAAASHTNELIDLRNADSIKAHRPILIAHRGGVTGPEAPECSAAAIRKAADCGYAMVELDIRRSRDGVPVVFHDADMMEDCGIEGSVADYTAAELGRIRYKNTDEPIITLDAALVMCKQRSLGVMFDLKSRDGAAFYNTIRGLIVKHGLERASMTISGDPEWRAMVEDVCMATVTGEEAQAAARGEAPDLRGRYWFGLPEHLPSERVGALQRCGALVIPAINTFRYPEENHMELARRDIERLNAAGADGFQIDSAYNPYFPTLPCE